MNVAEAVKILDGIETEFENQGIQTQGERTRESLAELNTDEDRMALLGAVTLAMFKGNEGSAEAVMEAFVMGVDFGKKLRDMYPLPKVED